MSECDAEQLSDPKQFPLTHLSHFIGIGSGWDNYYGIIAPQCKGQLQKYYSQRYPRAYDVAVLAKQAYQRGQLVSAEEAVPTYLREKVTGLYP